MLVAGLADDAREKHVHLLVAVRLLVAERLLVAVRLLVAERLLVACLPTSRPVVSRRLDYL